MPFTTKNQGNFSQNFSFFRISRSHLIANISPNIANNEWGINVAQQNSERNKKENTTSKLNPTHHEYQQKITVPKMAACCHVTIRIAMIMNLFVQDKTAKAKT